MHINTQLAPSATLSRFGSEEQKRRWIPDLVSASRIGCFAITEPDAGSDIASMSNNLWPPADKAGAKVLIEMG